MWTKYACIHFSLVPLYLSYTKNRKRIERMGVRK